MLGREVVEVGCGGRAVARSVGFAREAAAAGEFVNAVRWLQVVEVVDGFTRTFKLGRGVGCG
ncbi:MAG TPA: hypothetical protein VGL78_07070 [Solirubrobacteraceae bacterium]|jgi:hypothetical protein